MNLEIGFQDQNDCRKKFTNMDCVYKADVSDDDVYEASPTLKRYREMMALCIITEITAAKRARRLQEWYDDLSLEGKSKIDLQTITEDIGLTTDQQLNALNKMAEIYEQMAIAGFHITHRQSALSSALPIALNKMKEMRTKRYQDAKKPTVRLAPRTMAYGPKVIDLFGTKA